MQSSICRRTSRTSPTITGHQGLVMLQAMPYFRAGTSSCRTDRVISQHAAPHLH
jgi:hypothetical protein